MEWIAEHRWQLLIGAEVVFWGSVVGFLLLRYLWGLERLSVLVLGLTLVNEVWIAALGMIDYLETGRFSVFQIVIIAFILYALVQGKEGIKRIDQWMKYQVARFKGERVERPSDAHKYGAARARSERRGWLVHLLIYVAVHLIFLLQYGLDFAGKGPFADETANNVTRVWSVIMVVDTVISWSYTLFPKKERS